MRKILFKLEIFYFYLKKNILFILLGAILGSVVFIFRQQINSLYQALRPKTNYIGIDGLYTQEELPQEIKNLLSFGLTQNGANDKPIISPLTISYENQNNNLEYFFHLNPEIYWHNGKKFTSKDINYNFPGVDITPISENLVKISLEKPFSPLLSLLSQPILTNKLNGLGPYRLKRIQLKESYLKLIHLQPVNDKALPHLVYRFYQNENDLVEAFQLGEIDEIRTSQIPTQLNNSPNTKITPNIQANQKYLAIFINTQKFSEKQFRQSLAYATPKTRDKNERCIGPISTNSWAYNPEIKEYNFNPTRAKELIDKNSAQDIKITILDRRLLPQAEIIRDSWQKILKLKVEIVIENRLDSQNFDTVLAFGGIPHDPDQYYFWHSTQLDTNITRLNNSRIDKLLEEGRQINDPIERKKIYYDFQKYLLEESPAIFLNYPTVYTIQRIR